MSFLWIDQGDYERAAMQRDEYVPDELYEGQEPPAEVDDLGQTAPERREV